MRRHVLLMAFCLFGLGVGAVDAGAAERILDYHSDITLAADGGMQVTETIRVQAEGARIRHGIYRDFPTDYRDRQHHRYHVGFAVVGATRDGAPESWRTERQANGVRVYLGEEATLVAPGVHTWTIRYRTNRQIGFFPDHDELFWNVNGTGWIFPIDRASASVHLPLAVPAAKLEAYGYTGSQDSREQALAASVHDGGADYITTRPLGSNEGLSIVLEFPKGVIIAPSTAQRWRWWLADNSNILLAVIALVGLWIYYVQVWRRKGRDPAAGPLVAEYEPPDGDSAAALRYVERMGYDDTCFTAGILGVAAKGGLDIREDDAKTYVATRRDGGKAVFSADEKALRDALFAGGADIEFKQGEHSRVQAARSAHQKALKAAFYSKYFLTNSLWLLPGVAITVVSAWLASLGGAEGTGFLLAWIGFWTVGVVLLFNRAAHGGRAAVGGWIMFVFFAAAELIAIAALGTLAGYALIPLCIALVVTNLMFYQWLKAPTQLGAKLLDRIRGFRWYLGVAEKQELDARYKPESRPDLFAAYLPYALALGVGNAWAERFSSALSPVQMEQARPSWYSGTGASGFNGASFTTFASSMTSGFGGAIASASMAPGSSSGSGGSSGGGGGGGGGGGW
jgi:uncharacterized membrane protein YgcG